MIRKIIDGQQNNTTSKFFDPFLWIYYIVLLYLLTHKAIARSLKNEEEFYEPNMIAAMMLPLRRTLVRPIFIAANKEFNEDLYNVITLH